MKPTLRSMAAAIALLVSATSALSTANTTSVLNETVSTAPTTSVPSTPAAAAAAAMTAPPTTSLVLSDPSLNNSQLTAIFAAASPDLESVRLTGVPLDPLSWGVFASLPKLKHLQIDSNSVSRITDSSTAILPALTELTFNSVRIDHFALHAPNLEKLTFINTRLARIPESVFTYSKLQALTLTTQFIFRPLVLTAQQHQFLEAVPSLTIALTNPRDEEIVSRLSTNSSARYGNYFDSVDLSLLVEGSNESVLLHRNPLLSVTVVDKETAALYNDVLERRVVARGLTQPDYAALEPLPFNYCLGVQRNMLLANCMEGFCPSDGACVAYDQHSDLSLPSGCDYNVASVRSACGVKNGVGSQICEFHCFGAYQPRSQFKFFIPFRAELGPKIVRNVIDPDLQELTTKEVPFLSNVFVDKVGELDLTSRVTEVLIAGGRSERSSRGVVADVVVSFDLLKHADSVTSLSLLNMDLRKSDLAAILASSSKALTSLNLRNTKLADLPETVFAKNEQLETLTLSLNDITTIAFKATTLPNLKNLDLRQNSLTAIDIATSSLQTLDLSSNNLVRIPPSVFSLMKLVTLNLEDNLLTAPLVLTPSQLAFLNAIPNLKLSTLPSSESLRDPEDTSTSISPTVTPIRVTSTPQGSDGTGGDSSPSKYPTATSAASPEAPSSGGVVVATDGTSSASLLANGGTVSSLKGISVILVSDQVASQYNGQLEQKQKQATTTPHPRSDTSRSTPVATLRNTSIPSDSSKSAELLGESSSSADLVASAGSTQQDPFSQETGSSGHSNETPGSVGDGRASNPSTSPGESHVPGSAGTPSTSASNEASGMSLSTKLMLGGFVSAFFVVLLVVLLVLHKRRSRATKTASSYLAMTDTSDVGTQPSSRPILAWWKDDGLLSHRLNAGDLGDVRAIGSGESGTVLWLVNYRAGSRQLVSKRLIQGEGPPHDAKMLQLVTEAKIASTLEYPSIVRFVGVAWTDKTDLQVLYEYMPNGDLGSYLASPDVSALPWGREKLQFAIDIIEALVYTHSFNPPMLHRNLKASNVLLDDKGKAKLGDFGCARPESESNTMTTSGVGSGRWLAPEILSGSPSYGASSDIYSFGVVLCELDTHREPYAEEAVTMPETELLQRVARGELRPSLSASCPPEIREIAEACLALDPESRPNAMQVSHQFRSLRRRRHDK